MSDHEYVRPTFASLQEEELFYATNICGAVVVIACVALIAGIFLGYLTLDELDLQIKERASFDVDERKYASALHPIVAQRHLLLVTLLMLNALCYEALPIFLDRLVPSWVAILLSTTLVLLFGEILPSAIFTGPEQLKLGYHLVPLVKLLLWIMYPFAKPLSLILDHIVHGHEGDNPTGEAYNRGELAALVKIQYEQRMNTSISHPGGIGKKGLLWDHSNGADDSFHALKQEMMQVIDEKNNDLLQDDETVPDLERNLRPPMEKDEINVVLGALQLKTKFAMDVYTPLRHVYAIPEDMILTKDNTARIYGNGFSRVPVYRRNPEDPEDESLLLGFIMARQLILIDWDDERPVSTLPIYRPEVVSPRMNLVRLLCLLREGGTLMAFVCARPDLAIRSLEKELPIPVEAGLVGIVTLEDVIVSIIQTRIYDETDLRDRALAIATLQNWAVGVLQRFARKKKKSKLNGSPRRIPSPDGRKPATETTPLLKQQTLWDSI